MFTLHHTLLGC